MKIRTVLQAADAQAIAAAAEAEATANAWPVSIAVVDDGGHLLRLHRIEGAPPATALISAAKARTAALVRRASKHYEEMINKGRMAFLSAPNLEGMLEGGVPIFKDGECLGADGVSGVILAQDVQIATAGIAALGL